MAEQAWFLANALGTVRRLDRAGIATQIPAIAFPDEVMDAFLTLPDDFLGAEWHVVTKGRRPGIYPSWYCFISLKADGSANAYIFRNFAASQTQCISGAIYDKYMTKDEAVTAYNRARDDNLIQYL